MKDTMSILNKEELYKANWLTLTKIHYKDHKDVEREWEAVERVNSSGAVAMIATLEPSKRLILIKQFRPPANAVVIEFPAGLIDEGETADSTAVRELYEETGYTGIVTKMTPPVYSSPGLSSEAVNIAFMTIDETAACNQNVTPKLESTENIETIIIEMDELSNFLQQSIDTGYVIDAKVMSFSLFSSI